MLGNRVSRHGDRETETRSLREETMRNLRWAAELAMDDKPKREVLGLMQLRALASLFHGAASMSLEGVGAVSVTA